MRYRFSLAALAVVVFAPLTAHAQTHSDAGVTHAPAAPSTPMLHGAPLPNTVDVYRLPGAVLGTLLAGPEGGPPARPPRAPRGGGAGGRSSNRSCRTKRRPLCRASGAS